MGLNTRDAKPEVMSADVRNWCDAAATEERRTVVLTLSGATEITTIESELEALGADVLSSGSGATIVTIGPEAARVVSRLRGVVRMELPGRLDPKCSGP